MLKRNLVKVSSGLKRAVSGGEWMRMFGTAPGSGHGSFQEFCQDIQLIKELMAENDQNISDDSTVVLNGLLSAILGHVTSETATSTGHPGPCVEKLVEETLLELLVRWSCRLSSVDELWRVQLRFYLVLLSESPQPVLQQMSIVRPLKRVLHECSRSAAVALSPTAQSDGRLGIAEAFVQLLLHLCVVMNRDKSALEQFLAVDRNTMASSSASNAQSQCAEFAIFRYLMPYMHHSSLVGSQARDGLLLCLLQASSNSRALSYIKDDSNFCLMLALGLGGLYSELPTQLKFSIQDWSSLSSTIHLVPGLDTFVQSLEFCNDVVQLSLPGISSQLASLIRSGFLEQILAHMLLQPTSKNTVAAIAYLNVIISSVFEPALLCEIIRFILQYADDDGNRLLHRLIAYINSRDSQLSNVTLSLFHSLLDLNCEDVMLELALRYLLPGDHIQPSQWPLVSQPDLSSNAATKFLVIIPSCCWQGEQMYMDHNEKLVEKALKNAVAPAKSVIAGILQSGDKAESRTPSPLPPPPCSASVVAGYRQLLSEAHDAVQDCAVACGCWSSRYNECHASARAHDAVPFSGWLSLAAPASPAVVSGYRNSTSSAARTPDDKLTSRTLSTQSTDSGIGRPARTDSLQPERTASASMLHRSDSTDSCSSHASAAFPTSGLFLAALLDRLGGLLTQDSYTTLLVTALLSRLAHYPQPLLTSYLLNHSLTLKAEVPSLHRTLNNLKDLVDSMNKRYEDLPTSLARARKTLLVRQSAAGQVGGSSVVSTPSPGQQATVDATGSTPGTRQTSLPYPHADVGVADAGRQARQQSSNRAGSKTAPGTKKKRPATQMLFSIVMLHEFLKDMSAIAQEQSLQHFDMIDQLDMVP